LCGFSLHICSSKIDACLKDLWKTHIAANMITEVVHCEKRIGVGFWSPQLHLSDHLHVVIKEHAHKCSPYFDPIIIPDLRKESIISLR